jgi:hypothetical protein
VGAEQLVYVLVTLWWTRPEDDKDNDVMGEVDNMEDGIVADAAVKDDIGDQLFVFDNICSGPILYNL